MRVWTADETGAVDTAAPQVLEGHGDGVRSLAWSPDSRHISSASKDNTVRVWSLLDIESFRQALKAIKLWDWNVTNADVSSAVSFFTSIVDLTSIPV